MSLDTRGIDPQRLLPQSLEDRLLGWLGRFGGAILLGSTALIWASLATWSVLDPSLTHTTAAHARNFAGPIGAIVSDLLFQTLGFAAVLALIAPLVWGLEMLRTEHVVGGRSKLGFYPISVLTIAGAISALPVFESWPLRHGYGGLLGDSLLHLMTKVFSVLNEDRAPVAAGVVLAAAAIQVSGKAIGFEAEAIARALLRSFRSAMTRPRGEMIRAAPALAANTATGLWARFRRGSAEAAQNHSYTTLESFGTPEPAPPSLSHAPDAFARLEIDPHNDGARPFAGHSLAMPAAVSAAQHQGVAPAAQHVVEDVPIDDAVEPLYDFDDNIEDSSRAIAARFAPASS
jgi:S-DNA-T family DNA segregation ATPase FtsK/SpoIIIE